MGKLIAIVGRPNVGKSTLFNRLTQTRRAIVDDTAGTTRDRQYGKVDWCGQEFSIVDTGGWVVNSDDIFEEEINKQVEIAIEEAYSIYPNARSLFSRLRQSFSTLTKSSRNTFFPKNFSMSWRAVIPIFFIFSPPFPIMIPF